jgi:hypothetical protein
MDFRRSIGKGGGAPAPGHDTRDIYCYRDGRRQACPDVAGETAADLVADGNYFHVATAAVTPDAAVCLGLFANRCGHWLLVIDFGHASLPGVAIECDDLFLASAALRDLTPLLRVLGVRG